MTDQLILLQLKEMPDNLKQEVLDFIGYLSAKYKLPSNQQPRNKKHFGKYRGSLKTGLSLEEMNVQLQQMRDEWERPIS